MPTPSVEPCILSPPLDPQFLRSSHTSCPPEQERQWSQLPAARHNESPSLPEQLDLGQPLTPPADEGVARIPDRRDGADNANSPMDVDGEGLVRDHHTPTSPLEGMRETALREAKNVSPRTPTSPSPTPLFTISTERSNVRLQANSTSSFLRPGSQFRGTQQSDRQVYDVHVEIKHVDMNESFLCGFLRIQGLTQEHPTLTTYFEGEIVGNKYTFQTKHAEWGSNEKVDMQHWARFPAWRPLAKAAKQPSFSYKGFAQKEHLFMRWKEYFLVPDHRVQTISGASFEGFYYICFNQCSGTVSGIYFHSKSEKYQQLELTHVDDRGCMGAMEFR